MFLDVVTREVPDLVAAGPRVYGEGNRVALGQEACTIHGRLGECQACLTLCIDHVEPYKRKLGQPNVQAMKYVTTVETNVSQPIGLVSRTRGSDLTPAAVLEVGRVLCLGRDAAAQLRGPQGAPSRRGPLVMPRVAAKAPQALVAIRGAVVGCLARLPGHGRGPVGGGEDHEQGLGQVHGDFCSEGEALGHAKEEGGRGVWGLGGERRERLLLATREPKQGSVPVASRRGWRGAGRRTRTYRTARLCAGPANKITAKRARPRRDSASRGRMGTLRRDTKPRYGN